MKRKLFMTIIMGICFMMVQTVVAYAESIIEKQKEIDQYIFEENSTKLEEKGIFVTHTGALEDVVEIGISPFTEENVDYLYEIFGKDTVKIVEGEQAVTYSLGKESTESVQNNTTSVSAETNENELNRNILYIIAIIAILAVGLNFVTRNKKR
jgi:hypothetical protein